nr:hypothetical protein K-LCC10_0101 [Kaumoebavirus]
MEQWLAGLLKEFPEFECETDVSDEKIVIDLKWRDSNLPRFFMLTIDLDNRVPVYFTAQLCDLWNGDDECAYDVSGWTDLENSLLKSFIMKHLYLDEFHERVKELNSYRKTVEELKKLVTHIQGNNEQFLRGLTAHFKYQEGGEGYEEAIEHFESLKS